MQGEKRGKIFLSEVETSGCIPSPFQGEFMPRSGYGIQPEVSTSGRKFHFLRERARNQFVCATPTPLKLIKSVSAASLAFVLSTTTFPV